MRRYFYTDPLAAAWMAKHFGMRFVDSDMLTEMEALGKRRNWEGGIVVTHVIHPDSLHLLEPQVGDRLSDGYLVVWNHPSPKTYQRRLYLAQSDVAKGSYGIIQRDGIAFHWPESEDA